MKRLLILLMMINNCLMLFSQTRQLRHISKENGLPTKEAFYITQDNTGYIWVATSGGVCRYNGKRFDTYPNDSLLRNSEIIQLHGDSKGRVWFFSKEGEILCMEKGMVFKYHGTGNKAGGQNNYMFRLFYESLNGKITFGNWRTLHHKISTTSMRLEDNCFFVYDENGQTYAFGNKSVSINTKKKLYYGTTFSETTRFVKTDRGVIAACSDSLAYLILPNKKRVEQLTIDTLFKCKTVYHIEKGDGRQIIAGTSNGVYFLDLIENKLIVKEHYLPNTSVSCVKKTSEGFIWMSTLNDGVWLLDPYHLPVYKLNSGNFEISFMNAHNRVFACEGKIIQLNGKTEELLYNFNDHTLEIRDILFKGNDMVVGTNCGCYFIDKKKKSVEYKYLNKKSGTYKGLGAVKKLAFNGDTLVVASHIGIFKVKNFRNKYLADCLTNDNILGLYVNANTNYFCSKNGLFKLVGGKKNKMSNESFTTLSGKNDSIFAGTRTGKILLISNQSSKPIGKTNEPFFKLRVCEKGELIAYGNKGITLFDEGGGKSLDRSNGLFDDEINAADYVRDTLFFAAKDGFYFTLYRGKMKSLTSPKIVLTKINVDGTELEVKEKIELTYKNKLIDIKYDVINFHGDKEYYEYSINDQSWIKTEARQVMLSSMPPGVYHIRFRAMAPGSSWSNSSPISVEVMPPFWQETWFKLVFILTIGILIFLFFKIKVLTYNKDVVRELIILITNKLKQKESLTVKRATDGSMVSVLVKDLLFIEASGNYSEFSTKKGKVLVRGNIKEMEQKFQKEKFNTIVRVHRSFLINKDNVLGFNGTKILISDHEIPSGKAEVFKKQHELIRKELLSKKI